MKPIQLLVLVSLFAIFFSCNTESIETVLFAVPKYKSLDEIRNNVQIESARSTNSDGKIYVTAKYLFYIAQEEGVHIFDNQNPSNPQNIAFIRIEGLHDIAVKDNYLYADNFRDLLVFDISDINTISLAQTLGNVIDFSPIYPSQAEYYDYENSDWNEGDLLIGFNLEYREKPDYEYDDISIFDGLESSSIGTGGSYAKFQIKNNALYTLDNWKLNIFNISTSTETFFDHNLYLNNWFGNGILETLFIQKQYLFVGATDGMYIVDVQNEFNPQFVSQFTHGLACDPVVVNQNVAYLTIRANNTCWGNEIESQINVIDISNINNPILSSTYLIDEPYGLGYHNNTLYVCNDLNKLNIFDASTNDLQLENTYNINVKDVIPLETHLIAVGNQKIIQFSYQDNFELNIISEINF